MGFGTKELMSSGIRLFMTLGLWGYGVVETMPTIDILVGDDRQSVLIVEPKLA
jgi:hypothetical protein